MLFHLLHGMKQIISAVTKIVGSISAGGALTLASAGGLTIGGISIAVEGVIAGAIQVSYGGTVISAAASNFRNDVAKFSELAKSNGSSKSSNINKVDDKYLKKNGIDAHELKYDILGKKAPISQYDIYVDKATGELLIFKKGGKGVGIPTGEFIK